MRKPLLTFYLLVMVCMARAQSDSVYRAYYHSVKRQIRKDISFRVGAETSVTSINHSTFCTGIEPRLEARGWGFVFEFSILWFHNTNAVEYSFDNGSSFANTPNRYSIEKGQVSLSRLVATFPIHKGIYQLFVGGVYSNYTASVIPINRLYKLVDTTTAPVLIKTMGNIDAVTAVLTLSHEIWMRNQEFSISLTAHIPVMVAISYPNGARPYYYYSPRSRDLVQLGLVYNLQPKFRCSPYKTKPLL